MTRRFSISYFSEVSAIITLTVSDGYIRAVGEHPTEGADLLPNWFHFSHGSGVDRYDNDNDFEGDLVVQTYIGDDRRDAILETLDKIAKELWPGPKQMIENYEPPGIDTDNDDEMYQHFRQVILYAIPSGSRSSPTWETALDR